MWIWLAMMLMAFAGVPALAAPMPGGASEASSILDEDIFSPLRRDLMLADEAAAEEDLEASMSDAELMIYLLRRIERAVIYVMVITCLLVGQQMWRLTVLSKSQRNIL